MVCHGWAAAHAFLFFSTALVLGSFAGQAASLVPTNPAEGAWPADADSASPQIPLQTPEQLQNKFSLEKNAGQWGGHVGFAIHASGSRGYVTPDRLMLVLDGPASFPADPSAWRLGVPDDAAIAHTAVEMRLVGADPSARALEDGRQAQVSNHFRGADQAAWRTRVPHFSAVTYVDVYPNIDVAYHGDAEGRLKYDFIVRPGGDPSQIQLAFTGQESLAFASGGALVLHTAQGDIIKGAPVSFQQAPGANAPVASAYRAVESSTVGFAVGSYDVSLPLVIDPLVYSTYVGGTNYDQNIVSQTMGIALDASKNAYFSGLTFSNDYPVTPGAYQTTAAGGYCDAFVTKIDATGSSLVYSTYLAGTAYEYGFDVAVDRNGNAYISGATGSTDFPVTVGAFQSTYGGGPDDAFVAKLDATGSSLLYSTFLGGTNYEGGLGIAVNAAEEAYVAGPTESTNFPVTPGSYQPLHAGGGYDAYVTRLDATGSSLVYSTFIGSTAQDEARAIALLGDEAYITGMTMSTAYPTTPGAYQTTNAGYGDFLVTKLDAAGAGLAYSTLVGGTDLDWGMSIDVDAGGNAYVSGDARSPDFPTTPGAFQPALAGGGGDAAVVKVNPAGTALAYSTYLGGAADYDIGWGIDVDSTGRAFVTGTTYSTDFPTTPGAFQPVHAGVAGSPDAYLARVATNGASLVYSTFLGGTDWDLALGLAVDDACHAYVMGWSWSTDYPTTPGAYQTAVNGYSDAFVTNVDPTAGPGAGSPCTIGPDPDPQPKPVCDLGDWSASGDGLDYALDGDGAWLDEDHGLWACLCPFLPYVHAWETGHVDQSPWTGSDPHGWANGGAEIRPCAPICGLEGLTVEADSNDTTPVVVGIEGGPLACPCPPPTNGTFPECEVGKALCPPPIEDWVQVDVAQAIQPTSGWEAVRIATCIGCTVGESGAWQILPTSATAAASVSCLCLADVSASFAALPVTPSAAIAVNPDCVCAMLKDPPPCGADCPPPTNGTAPECPVPCPPPLEGDLPHCSVALPPPLIGVPPACVNPGPSLECIEPEGRGEGEETGQIPPTRRFAPFS